MRLEAAEMIISLRTADGEPHRCAGCDSEICLDLSKMTESLSCSRCGRLVAPLKDGLTVATDVDAPGLDALLDVYKNMLPARLLINLDGRSYMPSGELGKLIPLAKALKSRGCKITLCNVAPNIAEVFKISTVGHMFILARDEVAGVKEIKRMRVKRNSGTTKRKGWLTVFRWWN